MEIGISRNLFEYQVFVNCFTLGKKCNLTHGVWLPTINIRLKTPSMLSRPVTLAHKYQYTISINDENHNSQNHWTNR